MALIIDPENKGIPIIGSKMISSYGYRISSPSPTSFGCGEAPQDEAPVDEQRAASQQHVERDGAVSIIRTCTRRASSSVGRRQPSAGESRAAQPSVDVCALAHEPPNQAGAEVLDHQHDRPLIESVVALGNPAARTLRAV